jgi:copper(I)-binding protein
MTHRSPLRHGFLTSVAIAMLGLIAVHPEARAAEMTTVAQAQMEHGAPGATSGVAMFKLGDLTVTSPWTRATPGGAKIAGGYLKITNNGTAADRFVDAKSDVSDRVEIHEMSMSDGIMKTAAAQRSGDQAGRNGRTEIRRLSPDVHGSQAATQARRYTQGHAAIRKGGTARGEL